MLVIRATDAAGNTEQVKLFLVGRDHTAPPVPELFGMASLSRLAFQSIEGRTEPGASVTIQAGVETISLASSVESGFFVTSINLAPGVNNLSVTATDDAGNTSPPVAVRIVSDPNLTLPPGQSAQINISSGDTQRGLAGAELPRPLIAIVTDSAGEPVSNVPVRFTVLQGGGQFVGGAAATVEAATDARGRAAARYVSGNTGGLQLIRADFAGNISSAAKFIAAAVAPPADGTTTVSGVVLDQNLRALPNVLVRISGQQTRTGADGRFRVGNTVAGPHQVLELIGREQVALPGRWPNISYDMDVLPGVDNSLGRPLFLPKVNDGVALPLDANSIVTRDTTYELPVIGGEPPVRVTARAGTRVTFPPDATDKRLSVTRIAPSRVPMPLEDGLSTNIYISVQPAGALFEPSLEVSFPNVDRSPAGSAVLLMSFDHDAGRYVRVGTGHVSADGKQISSDAGSGIRVGAWHAPPPQPKPENSRHRRFGCALRVRGVRGAEHGATDGNGRRWQHVIHGDRLVVARSRRRGGAV